MQRTSLITALNEADRSTLGAVEVEDWHEEGDNLVLCLADDETWVIPKQDITVCRRGTSEVADEEGNVHGMTFTMLMPWQPTPNV